jgi:hypothetical protein
MGMTTPGKSTVFFNGRIGRISGTSSEFINSSSSDESKGMNSVSVSSISDKNI